jgi:D-glycero-alpha-D-manno-heptose 1-phosphate guanylyltransferase
MQKKEAIILAGGFGTRLQTVVSELPKPMAPIRGKPFLTYLLRYLKHFGFEKVILSTGHLAEKISDYYGDSFDGIELAYCVEKTPLGTGGALKFSLEKSASDEVLVLNGDSFFDVQHDQFESFHKANHSDFSICARTVTDAGRYGTLELANSRITSFREKNMQAVPGIINGGVYLLNRGFFLENSPQQEAFSLEKDFLEKFVEKFAFFAFVSDSYFIDIGIPEDFNRAQNEFERFKY